MVLGVISLILEKEKDVQIPDDDDDDDDNNNDGPENNLVCDGVVGLDEDQDCREMTPSTSKGGFRNYVQIENGGRIPVYFPLQFFTAPYFSHVLLEHLVSLSQLRSCLQQS